MTSVSLKQVRMISSERCTQVLVTNKNHDALKNDAAIENDNAHENDDTLQ